MLLFVISVLLFIPTLTGLVTMLGLWTYADAKVRTDHPVVWTLIVLLVPNLVGLIIYLAVGRTKDVKSPGKFKKPLLVFAVSFVLAAGLMIGSFANLMVDAGSNFPSWHENSIGVSIGKTENYWNRQWTVSFKYSTEEITKTVNLSAEDLAAFRVIGSCDSGKLYLKISQDETEKIIDISDIYTGEVDLYGFHAGKVKLTIYNDEARDASVTVSWRG